MHLITETLNISVGFRLSRGAFYSSIGTIDTNGITLLPLVFYWWNASHYGDLEYYWWFQAECGCILLVHCYDWYDWYQWNNTYSIGILLVKCISLRRLKIFPSATGWVGVHSTRPLVRLVRLVQWNNTYSVGILLVKCISLRRIKYFCWLQVEWGCILLVHWYDWYQWNNTYSIGILLVKCISLRGLKIFLLVSAECGCILLVHWND